MVLMTIIFSVGFLSCDNEDEVEDDPTSFSIVGCWEECDSEGIPTTIEQFHYEFNSDGTGKWFTTGAVDWDNSSTFTYKFTDGQPTGVIICYFEDDDDLKGYTTYNNGILKIAWVGGDTFLLRRVIE